MRVGRLVVVDDRRSSRTAAPRPRRACADQRIISRSSAASSRHQICSRISRKSSACRGGAGMPRASAEYRWWWPQTRPGVTFATWPFCWSGTGVRSPPHVTDRSAPRTRAVPRAELVPAPRAVPSCWRRQYDRGVGLAESPTVERVELDDRSWIDVVRGFMPDAEADGLRDELLATAPFEQGKVFRYEKWVLEPRFGTMQRGAGRHPALVEAQDWIQRRYKVMFDGLALAWYRNERDSVGWHRDPRAEVARRHGHRGADARPAAPVRRQAQHRARPARQLRRLLRRRARPRASERRPAGDGGTYATGLAARRPQVIASDARPGVGAVAVDVQRGRPDTAPSYYDARRFSKR